MSYTSSFPPEFESPKIKATPEYGIKYAKAMLEAFNFSTGNMFRNDRDIIKTFDMLAQGEIEVDSIKNLLGYYKTKTDQEMMDSLSYVDVKVVNILTKLVNNAIGKLNELRYDISLTPIDPLAIDKQKQFEKAIRMYNEMKEFLNVTKIPAQELFGDIDFDAIPEDPDELMLDANMNPKLNAAMKSEMTIKMLHAVNDWPQKQNEFAYDLVAYGMAINYTYLDKNLVPRMKPILCSDFIHSAVRSEAFDNLEYAGHIERISPNQFIREASSSMTKEEMDAVIRTYSPNYDTYAMAQYEHHDGLGRIPVFRFQFLTENTDKYVAKKGKYNGQVYQRKDHNFTPNDIERPRFESGEKRLITNTYTAKYSGTYILDSDFIYGYGLDVSSQRTNTSMVDEKLNYIVFAPFMKNGKVVSPLSQVLEPYMMFNLAWNKAKKIIGRGWSGALEMDFSAFESVALGKAGKVWTPRELFQYFLEEDILIKRKNTNIYGQSNGSAIEQKSIGLQLTDYFNTMSMSAQYMKEALGLNDYSDGSTVGDRTAVGVMNAAQASSNTNLSYLFRALTSIYERTSMSMLLLAQKSLRSGNRLAGWIPSMGRSTARFFEADMDVAIHDYGLVVEQQPDKMAWDRLYMLIDKAVELGEANGGISIDDAIFIHQIDNFKQALEVTKVRRKRRLKEAQQVADQAAERQMKINQSAADAKTQGDLAVIKEQEEKDYRVMQKKAEIDEKLLRLEWSLRNEGLGRVADTRLEGVLNTNTTAIIKEEQKKLQKENKN